MSDSRSSQSSGAQVGRAEAGGCQINQLLKDRGGWGCLNCQGDERKEQRRASCLKRKELAGREHSWQQWTIRSESRSSVLNTKHFMFLRGIRNWITWSKPTPIWGEDASPHTNPSVRFVQRWTIFTALKHRERSYQSVLRNVTADLPPRGQPFPFVPCGCAEIRKLAVAMVAIVDTRLIAWQQYWCLFVWLCTLYPNTEYEQQVIDSTSQRSRDKTKVLWERCWPLIIPVAFAV